MRIGSLVAKGVATFEVGSVGAPSITFSGSTTAGFFAPAPGQVAIAAGAGVNVFELATNGKLTLTTGYAALLPTAGTPGDDNAAVTKEWVEDNFVIGQISTLALNDLSDVTAPSPTNNDFLIRSGGVWVNADPTTAQQTMGVEVGVDVQAQNAQLQNIADAGAPADNEFLVGDSSGDWAIETAAQARDSLGLVAGGAGDIWVEKAGDTMTGNLVMSGGTDITLPDAPTAGTDAANKAYVDAAVTGLNWLDPVYYIDFIGDSYGVDVTKDLQTPGNSTDTNIQSVEDSDMIIIGVGPDAQGLTWTAVGVSGNTTTLTGLKSGDVVRWDSDAANGFLDPTWEKVQVDDGGCHISATIFGSEMTLGTNAQQARWGNGIVTNASKRGSMFGFDNSILQLVVDDANSNATKVILTNMANGNVTDTADGATATGFSFSTTQQGTAGLPEISEITCLGASGLPTSGTAAYFTFQAVGPTNYYVWYSVNGGTMADPAPGGTGIQVDVEPSDDAKAVAQKTSGTIAQTTFNAGDTRVNNEYDAWWGISADFGAVETNTITVEAQANISDSDYFYVYGAVQAPQEVAKTVLTNNANGAAADTVDGAVPTNFRFTKLVDGDGSNPETTQIENACTLSLPQSGPAAYFDFNDGSGGYRVWLDVDNNNTPPAAGGNTLVEVDLSAAYCAATVAQTILAAINASAANSTVTSTATFMDGSNASDGGLRFHVWFDKSGSATDPAPTNSFGGIEVDISGDTSANDVANSIKTAVDAYYAQLGGGQIGESALWEVSVSSGDVTFTSRHSGRATPAADGVGCSGGTWAYSRDQQGTYTGPSNNDAFFVSNPDSFNAGNQYVYSTTSGSWIQFGGATTILPGIGLSQSGQFFNVNLGPGIYENPSDEVSVHFWDTANEALILTTDGSTRDFNNVNASLHLLLDNTGTGDLTQSSAGLKVAAAGISETELATSVAGDGLAGGAGTPLSVNAGQGLIINTDIVDLDINTSEFEFVGASPAGVLNLKDGGIADSKLALDYVEVAGDTMTGDLTMGAGAQVLMDGSAGAGAPGIAVSGDPDTGLYSVGSNQLGVSTDGTLRATFNTTDLTMAVPVLYPDGAVSAPAVAFSDDTNTGMWSSADDHIDFATGGANRMTIADDGLITTGATAAATYATLVTGAGGEAIPNKQWVNDQLSALSTTTIIDGDADTKVSVEEGADDDTIRMDAGDSPAGYGAVTDIFLLNSSAWTVSMGTANTAATVGAPITVSAGAGNTTGAGGAVSINAGVGGATGNGGAISINGGVGGATSGAGGSATLQGGNAGGGGAGGDANVYAGTGASAGGTVNIAAGSSTGTDAGGAVNIDGGQGGATNANGGAVTIRSGAGQGSGNGGYSIMYGGNGTTTTNSYGGYAAIYGGTGWYGGDAKMAAGTGNQYGGNVVIQSGAGAANAGKVQIFCNNTSAGPGSNVTIDAGNGGGAAANGGNVEITAGNTGTSGYGGDIVLKAGDGTASGYGGHVNITTGDGNTPGHVHLTSGDSTDTARLRFNEATGTGTNYIGLKAPASVATNVVYTLPEAPAANGYGLVSTTAGVMSWIDLSSALDNSKITDGDSTTAETYIDTNENTDQITSQVGATTFHSEYEPLRAGLSGAVALRGGEGTSGNDGGNATINSGGGNGGGNGGNIVLGAGPGRAGGDGGNIIVDAGSDNGNGGLGGYLRMYSGAGDTGSGAVTIATANSLGYSGNILIQTGGASGGAQGNITLQGSVGTGGTAGSIIKLDAGSTAGAVDAGDVQIYAGDAGGSGAGGAVIIKAGDSGSGAVGHIALTTSDTALPVDVRFYEGSANGTEYIALRAPTQVTTTRVWVLPQNSPVDGYVLSTDGSGNTSWGDLGTLAATHIALGDLSDVTDTAPNTDQVVSLFVGNGSLKETQTLIGGTNLTAAVDQGADTVTLNVDDAFISNNGGDTFGDTTPGTWTVASGSTLTVATGGVLRVADLPTTSTDVVNKAYADSLAAGLDPKESVLVATAVGEDLTGGSWTGSYSSSGGPQNTGAFTNVDLTVAIDGTTAANTLGARVLVKNQGDAKQNGIYEVTTAGVTGVLTRAADQDGSPANEVSAGNFTFVEQGAQANTGWVVTGQGTLTLNTDNINWTQFTGAGSFTAGIGISQSGNTIDLDVDDLAAATIATGDYLAFHDINGTPAASGSITRKTTAADFITNLGLLTTTTGGSLGGTDGVLFNTSTNNVELDITNLGAATITGADELVFDDGASGSHAKTTVSDFLSDLDIVNLGAFSSAGILARTADDTYAEVVLTAGGVGLEGIDIQNGDGSGTPTIGLDIAGLTNIGAAPANTDELPIFDGTNNRAVTVANLADAVASDIAIGDLSDVNADSSSDAAGNVLVADGTDSYDTQKIQHIQSVTAQTSIAINHNIGQKYVTVQCYNGSDQMVIPQSVTLNSTTQCTVTFSPAFTGNVVIMGVPGVPVT